MSNCNTGPQPCGPPIVQFFGGDPQFKAIANAIISPTSSSVIGFDIVNAGKDYNSTPQAVLIDKCGRGSGSSLCVNMTPDGKSVKNITVCAPGNGYIPAPDGSLGGNERVWKEPYEGYVTTKDGGYYVVQPLRPIRCEKGSTYYPPDGPPRECQGETINLPLVPVKPQDPTSFGTPYPVVLCIEEIVVLDQGFGYRPGDELIITPDNGTKTELLINEFGNITGVKVIQGGCGFDDIPEMRTNSPTGFNATFTPIFSVTQIDPTKSIESQVGGDQIRLVTVIDCVGKFTPTRTFNVPR